MGIVNGLIIGVIVCCLALVVLAKLMESASAALVGMLPALIILWVIVMALRGMVRSLFK